MRVCQLEELCTAIIDCPHSTPEWLDHGIAIIRNYNIKKGQLDLSKLSYVHESTYQKRIERAIPEAGDLIISREAPMGEVCVIPENFKCCLGQRLVLLKVNKKKVSPQYLCFAIQSQYVQMQIKRINQTGSIVSNLNIPDLRALNIPLVDNYEKIGEVLSVIEAKNNCNEKISNNLESMAKTIYDYWFLQYDFPDENGKPYKSSGGKMIWNEELKREIPVGWEVSDLSLYITITRGVTYDENDIKYIPEDGYIPLLKSNNIQNNKLLLEDIIYVDRKNVTNEQYLSNNSVFVTMSSGSTEHVGKIAIIFYDMPYCYGAFCSKIEIRKEYKCFLSLFFASDYFKRKIRTIVVGTNIKNISNTHLLNNKLAMPSENILKKFEGIITPLFNKQGEMIRENQELASLRDFLIPLLMNGQVRIRP